MYKDVGQFATSNYAPRTILPADDIFIGMLNKLHTMGRGRVLGGLVGTLGSLSSFRNQSGGGGCLKPCQKAIVSCRSPHSLVVDNSTRRALCFTSLACVTIYNGGGVFMLLIMSPSFSLYLVRLRNPIFRDEQISLSNDKNSGWDSNGAASTNY